MKKIKPTRWSYTNISTPKFEYPDPRIVIAKHIGWQKYIGEDTHFSTPEPDNYNRAVLTEKPVECKFVENQVIYRDAIKKAWITVLLVAEEQSGEYEAWIERLKPLAHWRHLNAQKVKQRRFNAL